MTGASRSETRELPVAIIGGGPVGLVAGVHLLRQGETPLILEAGSAVGASIREWAHVRLFSPWSHLTEPVAVEMLESSGWSAPDPERVPLGGEFVARFLAPLAALPQVAASVQVNRRVVAVSRTDVDRARSEGREALPFELVVERGDGGTERHRARAVIDASGTYATPNPLGANGLPARGEAEARDRIHYGIPDVHGRLRTRYSGKRTVVLGSGHSAFNAVLELAELARIVRSTEVNWAIRRERIGAMFGDEEQDILPARGSLGARLRTLVERGDVPLFAGFRAKEVTKTGAGMVVRSDDGRVIGPVDEIVVTTGFRPDLAMLRELRLELDPALESPVGLAPLIDPSVHSCTTVQPHGYEELRHPEQDVFVVGMKSYGRAPTFLLPTGYEQVRSVVAGLTGDLEGARNRRLGLPGTGACVTEAGDSCCGFAPVVSISRGRSSSAVSDGA